MKHSRYLALFLICLFCTFSFNAYACLFPVFADLPLPQKIDCTMPGEEPASQFCDGFKTLALYSGYDSPSTDQLLLPSIQNTLSLFSGTPPTGTFLIPPDPDQKYLRNDLLTRICIFRI